MITLSKKLRGTKKFFAPSPLYKNKTKWGCRKWVRLASRLRFRPLSFIMEASSSASWQKWETYRRLNHVYCCTSRFRNEPLIQSTQRNSKAAKCVLKRFFHSKDGKSFFNLRHCSEAYRWSINQKKRNQRKNTKISENGNAWSLLHQTTMTLDNKGKEILVWPRERR